jgi:hypothetical protein
VDPAGVAGDGEGQGFVQLWRKIVAHARDHPQFGSLDIGSGVLAPGRGHQRVGGSMHHEGWSGDGSQPCTTIAGDDDGSDLPAKSGGL